MNIEPCEHEQLYPLEPCTPCQREADPAPPQPRTSVGPTFEAAFETVCQGCGFDIVPGESARMVAKPGQVARAAHAGACAKEVA